MGEAFTDEGLVAPIYATPVLPEEYGFSETYFVMSNAEQLYEAADAGSAVLTTLPQGTAVREADEAIYNEFKRIRLADGREGYVLRQNLRNASFGSRIYINANEDGWHITAFIANN